MGQCFTSLQDSSDIDQNNVNVNNNDRIVESESRDIENVESDELVCDRIRWSELKVDSFNPEDVQLGNGNFGTVIKATWRPQGNIKTLEVATKIFKIEKNDPFNEDFKTACRKAEDEFFTFRKLREMVVDTSRLIHIYGVVTGEMNHTNIAHFFHVSETCGGVGIVMKLERGGSLDVLIHGYSNGNRYPKDVTLSDKLHILYEIAKGLADMHEVGILHGDIKPNNILLTDTTWPPSIKFTDFGFTSFRESTKLNSTTLLRSTKYRGTPLYSAPEMLVNPFRPAADGKVAKPSRKTDMYAFGLVSWELLCECEVFPTIHDSEVRLCAAVHSNTRPDIALLPRETPDEVKNMIVACWDADRRKRKTARECIDLLEACRKIRFR